MTQVANLIPELVGALEGMAQQYLSDLDRVYLEVDTEADFQCLKVLEKLGRVNQLCEGRYSWSKLSQYYGSNSTSDSNRFSVKELPLTVTKEEVVTALVTMAKEYLTYGSEAWMTHSFMYAGEQTLRVLAALGLAKTEDDITYEWV